MENLAILILLLPALSALVNGLFGRWLKGASGYVAAAAMLGTLGCTATLFFNEELSKRIAELGGVAIPLYQWIPLGIAENAPVIEAKLWLDPLTLVMLWVVSFVGSLVFVYSIGYMHGDRGRPRFFAYLSLFAFSMYLLVLGANFLMLFIGWEGVGLCSYLLIGYYFDRPFDEEISCADAGKKAFITNRVGDFGFLLGILFIFTYFHTLDFNELFKAGGVVETFIVDPENQAVMGWLFATISLLLFLGACGKSAQIPLFIWLPDAMAGPTPVSALIHAATMVTAGVYMVARCNVIFSLSPSALAVVASVGAATAFVAATIGITQRDIKKVLAYSTVSQLGFMFLACGAGAYAIGIFHVFTHAFFKGCLFLCAGSVIHAMSGEQDMLKMGGLKKKMPTTHWTYLLATLAIAGIFPFAGFFSKDEILWNTVRHASPFFILLWVVALVAALMTAFYMFRSLYLTFYGETRADKHAWDHAHESPKTMTIPLMILAVGSLVVGWFGLPAYTNLDTFQRFLEPVTNRGAEVAALLNGAPHAAEVHHVPGAVAIEIALALLSLGVACAGIWAAHTFYRKRYPALPESMAKKFPGFYKLSWNLWHYNWFCMKVVVGGLMKAYRVILAFDIWIIDGVVNGCGLVARLVGREFRKMQNSQTQGYALWVLVGVNMLILIFLIVIKRGG